MKNEIWKTIEDYPDYQISNYGNVKSLKFGKEKIMKQEIDKGNYRRIELFKNGKGKTFKVHRLVYFTFNPNEDKLLEIKTKKRKRIIKHYILQQIKYLNELKAYKKRLKQLIK